MRTNNCDRMSHLYAIKIIAMILALKIALTKRFSKWRFLRVQGCSHLLIEIDSCTPIDYHK